MAVAFPPAHRARQPRPSDELVRLRQNTERMHTDRVQAEALAAQERAAGNRAQRKRARQLAVLNKRLFFKVSPVDALVIFPLVNAALLVRGIFRAVVYAADRMFEGLRWLYNNTIEPAASWIGNKIRNGLKRVVDFLPTRNSAFKDRLKRGIDRGWEWTKDRARAAKDWVADGFKRTVKNLFKWGSTFGPKTALGTFAGCMAVVVGVLFGAKWLHLHMIAQAATYPAWVQSLHPVITVFAGAIKPPLLAIAAATKRQAVVGWDNIVNSRLGRAAAFAFNAVVTPKFRRRVGIRHAEWRSVWSDIREDLTPAVSAAGNTIATGFRAMRAIWRYARGKTEQPEGVKAIAAIRADMRAARREAVGRRKFSEHVRTVIEHTLEKLEPEYWTDKSATTGVKGADQLRSVKAGINGEAVSGGGGGISIKDRLRLRCTRPQRPMRTPRAETATL